MTESPKNQAILPHYLETWFDPSQKGKLPLIEKDLAQASRSNQ
jgi:hypothetical protein